MKQVGGTHYQGTKVQHVEFCQLNRIPWCESAAIKYILRHRLKNGREDVEKAIHYVQLLVAMDYARRATVPQDALQKQYVISLKDFLSDKPLTKVERKAVELILDHQKDEGDERKLDEAVRLLKGLLKEYEDPPLEGLELL
jgi:hypothetical protein